MLYYYPATREIGGNLELKTLFPDSYQRVLRWNEIARNEPPTIEQQIEYTKEEIREFAVAEKEGDIVEMLDAVADIFVTGAYLEHLDPENEYTKAAQLIVETSAEVMGHALVTECILNVLDSNESKFVDVSQYDSNQLEFLLEVEKARLELQHGLGIHYVIRNGYAIFLDENNKIRKPSCFVDPDIADIVDRYFGEEVEVE